MSVRSGGGGSVRSSRASEPRSPYMPALDATEGDSLSKLLPEMPASGRSQAVSVRTGPSVSSVRSQPKTTIIFNLTKFLGDLGLADYEDLLRETGFDDYRSMLAIEEVDMDAIGMITGHKRKLIRAVAELNDEAREAGSMSDSRFPRSPDKQVRGGPPGDTLDLRRDSKASAGSENKPKVKKMKRRRRVKDAAQPPPPSIEEKAASAPSEVIMETLFPGDGLNFPQDGEMARMHYVGKFLDGKQFESSRARGRPFQFKIGVGQVIKGMDMAVKQMSRGQRAKAVIPPELAYGEEGRFPLIPPNASLLFEIQLIDFFDPAVDLTPRDQYEPDVDGTPRDMEDG